MRKPRHGRPEPSDTRTFVSLALQTVVNAFVYSTYLARLPDIRSGAGITLAALGVTMAVGNVAAVIGSIAAPPIVTRLGSRRVLLWAGTAYVLTLPLVASSTSLGVLVGAVVLMMFTNAVVDMALAIQSTTFSSRRARPVMSRLSGLYSLGTAGGGVVAAATVAVGVDVTVHLALLAGALALLLLMVGPGLLEIPPGRSSDAPTRSGGAARGRPSRCSS